MLQYIIELGNCCVLSEFSKHLILAIAKLRLFGIYLLLLCMFHKQTVCNELMCICGLHVYKQMYKNVYSMEKQQTRLVWFTIWAVRLLNT